MQCSALPLATQQIVAWCATLSHAFHSVPMRFLCDSRYQGLVQVRNGMYSWHKNDVNDGERVAFNQIMLSCGRCARELPDSIEVSVTAHRPVAVETR